jgi:hypothetical protein
VRRTFNDKFAPIKTHTMKKTLLLLAGSAILFASCGNGEADKAAEEARVQAAKDSTARAIEAENQAAAQAAAAQHAADSTKMAEDAKKTAEAPAKGSTKGHGTTKHETTTPAAPAPAPTIGNGKPQIGGDKKPVDPKAPQTIGNGKPKIGGGK